jgi:AcrR family transcriptional regulator
MVAASRAQKRARETRRRLARAAVELFCEKGIDATRIGEITERADLGKGTFYRHFATKNELMNELIRDAVERLIGHIRTRMARPASLEEALARLLEAHTAFFEERRQEFLLLFQGRLLLKLQREDRAELEGPFVDYLRELESQVRAFVAQGSAPDRIRRLACALAGFVSGFLSFAMVGLPPAEIQASLEPLRRAFVAGSLAFLTKKC